MLCELLYRDDMPFLATICTITSFIPDGHYLPDRSIHQSYKRISERWSKIAGSRESYKFWYMFSVLGTMSSVGSLEMNKAHALSSSLPKLPLISKQTAHALSTAPQTPRGGLDTSRIPCPEAGGSGGIREHAQPPSDNLAVQSWDSLRRGLDQVDQLMKMLQPLGRKGRPHQAWAMWLGKGNTFDSVSSSTKSWQWY